MSWSQVIVLLKKTEELKARCDSFVLKTDVHYPTDSNLLFDAIRKVISFSVKLCKEAGLSNFRQSKHNMKKVKRSFNYVRRLHYSKSKNEKKKQAQKLKIENAYREYMAICTTCIQKAERTISMKTKYGWIYQ